MGDDVIEWLAEVAQASGPGPAVVVGLSVDGREPVRLELSGHEPGERAERLIGALARWLRQRPTATIEAVARDAAGGVVDRLPLGGGAARDAVLMHPSPAPAGPGWDKLIETAMATGREYSRIGIEATERATRSAAVALDRLDRENAALRARITELETSIAETWQLKRKLAEEALELQARTERESELWRVGGVAVRAVLGRFAGEAAGSAIRSDLMSETLETLRPDQLERIMGVLDDAQRIALFEAIAAARRGSAAAAAASTNGPATDPGVSIARLNKGN